MRTYKDILLDCIFLFFCCSCLYYFMMESTFQGEFYCLDVSNFPQYLTHPVMSILFHLEGYLSHFDLRFLLWFPSAVVTLMYFIYVQLSHPSLCIHVVMIPPFSVRSLCSFISHISSTFYCC